MNINEIVTKKDLEEIKNELLETLNNLFEKQTERTPIRIYRTKEVIKMLGCSESTLQYYRDQKLINFTKVKSTYYYLESDILQFLQNHRNKNAA